MFSVGTNKLQNKALFDRICEINPGQPNKIGWLLTTSGFIVWKRLNSTLSESSSPAETAVVLC